MEFRAIVGPDGTARVVSVRSDSPVLGRCISRSFWLTEAEADAAAHNVARDEAAALRAAGQKDLFG